MSSSATISDEILISAAIEAMSNAYCPYSKFSVGAAIVSDSGVIYKGANVENCAYPVGICAERTAIGSAITSGARRFVKIAVSINSDEPAAPCGMCRQAIMEFGNIEVIMYSAKSGKRVDKNIKELLPMAFTSDKLLNGTL